MGIKTVAVYSDADRGARHVAMGRRAVAYRPARRRARATLVADKIIDAAKRTAAQAIHPGYGFLSEECRLRRGLREGRPRVHRPPPAAIRAMGSKSEAKKIMEKAKVPLVPPPPAEP